MILCYYCHKEPEQDKDFTHYKFCRTCGVLYDIKINGNEESISSTWQDYKKGEKYYSVFYYPTDQIVAVFLSKSSALGPVVSFTGDHNTITPSNIIRRMETILTFL